MYEAYGELPLRVFTDSPEQVDGEFRGLPYAFELAPDTPELSPWDTVASMARSRAMRDEQLLVQLVGGVAHAPARSVGARHRPRPWVADGASAHELLYEEWISLGIR